MAFRLSYIRKYNLLYSVQRRCMSTATNESQASQYKNAMDYCVNVVKEYDENDYVATLLVPHDNRGGIFIVKAFAAEMSNIVLKHTEDPMYQEQANTALQIRFQWWRDSLEKIYSQDPPDQPIARTLAALIAHRNLSKQWLDRIIDTREQFLLEDPPKDIAAFEEYAENSVSSLLYLCLESVDCRNDDANRAASHIGKALAITNIVRGIPAMALVDSIWLPKVITNHHEVPLNDIYDLARNTTEISKSNDDSMIALAKAVNEFVCMADIHLAKAKMLRKSVPQKGASVFLPAINATHYLRKLRKCEYNVFHPDLHTPPSPWEFLMWRMRLLTGRYWRTY